MSADDACTCSIYANEPSRWCEKHYGPIRRRRQHEKRMAAFYLDCALGLYPPIMPPLAQPRRIP